MAPLRRLTALLTMFLLTHVLLVGSGLACAMEPIAGRDSVASAPVTNASPARATSDCPEAMLDRPASEPGTPSSSEEAPCPLPWAPAGCHTAPCAPAVLGASAWMPTDGGEPATERSSLAVLPPHSVVLAPELPPPRA